MPLHFKETEADREERQWRREERARRKARAKAERYVLRHAEELEDQEKEKILHDAENWLRSRRKRKHERRLDDGDDDIHYRARHEKRDQFLGDDEELRFQESLQGAWEEDNAQDGIQAAFSGYNIPSRWTSHYDGAVVDPSLMDEEEYVEYMRQGMWKRTHAKEAEAEAERVKEKEAAAAKERAKVHERQRLAKEARAAEERRREEGARQRAVDAFKNYNERWTTLQTFTNASGGPPALSFGTLPWPVHPRASTVEGLTLEAVSSFLLSDFYAAEKPKKQRLKEALLLYHPDRFEGRWLGMIKAEDGGDDEIERGRVKEAVGIVARHLNELMEQVG